MATPIQSYMGQAMVASKSRPTTEAPPSLPGVGEEWSECLDESLERVGRDIEGDRDVIPVGGEHAIAQAVRWREANGVQQAVEAIPPLREGGAGSSELLGRGDVDFEDVGSDGSFRAVRLVRERARPAPERTTSAPSSWASSATAKASEASVSTPVMRSRLPSKSPMVFARICDSRGMHVGILGGTGRRAAGGGPIGLVRCPGHLGLA